MAASAPVRPTAPGRKVSTMRPPPLPRPGVNRAQTATPTLNGRATPVDISAKQRSPKRKAQSDLLMESIGVEETNINVVVRCRGRNDREVRENSAVVVSSDGIKGKKVELSMGPNALSNKAYQFDKVFSPAADQGMIFEEVVVPILDEVLAGFNCTIFAYGQTGTGKTYTMSGDITDMLPISEAAGIIPRVLHWLFDRLNRDETEKMETTVKCSFIELYNEELRDLLAVEDSTKLKIFDDANKNGRTTTIVQGMEETHIESASKGIKLLCEGSHKRQVAATKCNDLSSRSHTVFTMTVYIKRITESGEDFISASKLNLVDLAGSENIGRSGAENKRATEAGLINKSLLTLGRVINALVDKGSHIPYRESKLTRLLQDSLGGRTKTCIIATLSPAKSNLEETISTLDYAFRAKNIRNKPQMNQLVSKKTLIREFTSEIEKLKSELIATRHRNGHYLTADAYEELTTQSESRRILSEEQRDKIETMEANLRNKIQELFNLTNNFQSMKKDNDKIKGRLDSTRGLLDNTELVLSHAKKSLAEEIQLRKAYAETEEKLTATGESMRRTLEMTTTHIDQLHDKVERQYELHEANKAQWHKMEDRVVSRTGSVELQLDTLREQQSKLFTAMTDRVGSFVKTELAALQNSQASIRDKSTVLATSRLELEQQASTTRSQMIEVLGEICLLREDVKAKVGTGLDDLTSTAQRISAGIAQELGDLGGHLQDAQSSLERELTSMFDDIIERVSEQQAEIQRLRVQNARAQAALWTTNEDARVQLQQRIDDERSVAQIERSELLSKIGLLIQDASTKQERRLASHVEYANKRIKTSESEYSLSTQSYGDGIEAWDASNNALVESVQRSKHAAQRRLITNGESTDQHIRRIIDTTDAVHNETMQAVDAQMEHMDTQLAALDDIVARVKIHNEDHHLAHTATLTRFTDTVQQGYRDLQSSYETSAARIMQLNEITSDNDTDVTTSLQSLQDGGQIRSAVQEICENVIASQPADYKAAGNTPVRTQYQYTTTLPRTQPRDIIVDAMRSTTDRVVSPVKSTHKRSPTKLNRSPSKIPSSPSKTQIFNDPSRSMSRPPQLVSDLSSESLRSQTVTMGTLREINTNIKPISSSENEDIDFVHELKSSKKTIQQVNSAGKKTVRKTPSRTADGRENVVPSPKVDLNGNGGSGTGRALRRRVTEQS